MRAIVIAAAVFASVPAVAAVERVEFDQSIELPEIVRAQPAASAEKRITRWISGWKTVTVQPGQEVTPVFDITATAMEEDCTVIPGGGVSCRERFGQTDRRKFKLVFRNRPQVSAAETFDITLDWWRLSVANQRVAGKRYDWQVLRDRRNPVETIVLTPAP